MDVGRAIARKRNLEWFIPSAGWDATRRGRGSPCIWEFEDEERGVETNLRHGGRNEDIFGDYETEMLEIMKNW